MRHETKGEKTPLSRRFKGKAKALPLLLFLLSPLLYLPGCVSRSSYESDMAFLERQVIKERLNREDSEKKLEFKVQEKNKTLSAITERYGALQKEHEALQKWRNSFKSDLEALAKDLDELKLVIKTNQPGLKGSLGNTLLIHVIDMENKVRELLKVELPPPPAATPAPEETAPKEPQKSAP